MSEPVYRFRGFFSGDAAGTVAEFERIRAARGTLKTEYVVAAATPEDSPLHRHFEWDDAEAARLHRLNTASRLIRSIEVIRDDRPPVMMYVHTQTSEPVAREGEYRPISVIDARPDLYLSALAEASSGLAAAQRRMNELLDVARSTGAKKGEIARIMLAVQALQTANEAIAAIH